MGQFATFGTVISAALLLPTAVVFMRGRRAAQPSRPPWHVTTFIAALLLLAMALLPPLSAGANDSFAARVVQRMLLTSIVPPLLLITNPLPLLAAGLPGALRRRLGGAGRRLPASWRRPLLWALGPGPAWVLFVATFWLWHDALLTAASMARPWVHALEVASLLGSGLLYWWHITEAAPRHHDQLPQMIRIVYAFLGVLPIKVVGVVLLFGLETGGGIGRFEPTIRIGSTWLSDQSLGAILLWVLGGTPFAYATIVLAGRYLQVEDDKPHLPQSALTQRETWRHPGLFED